MFYNSPVTCFFTDKALKLALSFSKQLPVNNFTSRVIVIEVANFTVIAATANKATWVDNLEWRFLKDGSSTFCASIAKICNISIILASFPNKCKVAKIKPFYKRGLKTDPKNFGPILLPALTSKIIEQIINDQTIKFLSDNNVQYK